MTEYKGYNAEVEELYTRRRNELCNAESALDGLLETLDGVCEVLRAHERETRDGKEMTIGLKSLNRLDGPPSQQTSLFDEYRTALRDASRTTTSLLVAATEALHAIASYRMVVESDGMKFASAIQAEELDYDA